MSGWRRKYYEQLRDHLKKEVKRLKYVGRFNNQYANEDKEQSFADPSVLIRMLPQDFMTLGGGSGVQKFNNVITLFIGHSNFKDQGEDVYDLIDDIYQAAMLFVPVGDEFANIGKLTRIDEREDNDHDQRQIHEMDFNVTMMDYGAYIDRNKLQRTVTINPLTVDPVDELTE